MVNLTTRGLLKSDDPDLSRGFHQGKSRSLITKTPEFAIPRFLEMGNIMTRGLLKLDGPDLFRGFHHGRSRPLITRTPEFVIPDFPKWEISRHVASLNRTTQIYFGVSTMECPNLSSPGLLSSRLPISQNGKSLDTWPP
jgi:hypothetical protein